MSDVVTSGASSEEAAATRRLLAGLFRFVAGYFLDGPNAEGDALVGDASWRRSLVDGGLLGTELADVQPAALEVHRREFEELFRVPGDRFVPPFEQAYRPDKATPESTAVGECLALYRAAGYDLAPYPQVQADHVGHQARFTAAVLEREAACHERGDMGAAETAATWRSGFLADHGGWWPRLAARARERRPCMQVQLMSALVASLVTSAAE